MVYRVTITKEVTLDADSLPVGGAYDFTDEQLEQIWEAIECNTIQIDEYIEEVY